MTANLVAETEYATKTKMLNWLGYPCRFCQISSAHLDMECLKPEYENYERKKHTRGEKLVKLEWEQAAKNNSAVGSRVHLSSCLLYLTRYLSNTLCMVRHHMHLYIPIQSNLVYSNLK